MSVDKTREDQLRRLARRVGLVLRRLPSRFQIFPHDLYSLADDRGCALISPEDGLPGVDLDEVERYLAA